MFASPLDALSTAALMVSDSDEPSTTPVSPSERLEFAEIIAKEGIDVSPLSPSNLKRRRGNNNITSTTVSLTAISRGGLLSPAPSPTGDGGSTKVLVVDVSRNYDNVRTAVDEHFVRSLTPK